MPTPEELQAEIERLKAENELLSQGGGGTRFWRNLMGGLAICLGVVMLVLGAGAPVDGGGIGR